MTANRPTLRIDSARSRPDRPFVQLWAARDLVVLLAQRDVKLRYQHAWIGIGWAVIQPLFTMLALTLFQFLLAGKSESRIPYPLLAVSAMVPWTFVIHAFTVSSSSLLSFYGILQKVYFPRLVLPLAAVLAATADLAAAIPLVPLMMLYFGVVPGIRLLALPALVLLTVLLAAGGGIWLAMLNTRYRDTANALPFVTQLLFFLSPIAYPASRIPEPWRVAAGLNPMTGIIEGYRWSLFGEASPGLEVWLALSTFITAVLLVTGVNYFLGHEETLSDAL